MAWKLLMFVRMREHISLQGASIAPSKAQGCGRSFKPCSEHLDSHAQVTRSRQRRRQLGGGASPRAQKRLCLLASHVAGVCALLQVSPGYA